MKRWIRKANRWDDTLDSALLKLIEGCDCKEGRLPRPHPGVSMTEVDGTKKKALAIDVVYFFGLPFLHAEDKWSKYSFTCPLPNRQMSTMVAKLLEICPWLTEQDQRQVTPRIVVDTEFVTQELKTACTTHNLKLHPTTTEAHGQNGVAEAGNRVLRSFYRRIKAAEPSLCNNEWVKQSTYAKNICLGNKLHSSFELWHGHPPPIIDLHNKSPIIKAAYDAKVSRDKINRAKRAEPRHYQHIRANDWVLFYREKIGWIGPARVISVQGNTVTVIHNERSKSVGVHAVQKTDPPFWGFLDAQDCILDEDTATATSPPNTEAPGDQPTSDEPHTTSPNLDEPTTPIASTSPVETPNQITPTSTEGSDIHPIQRTTMAGMVLRNDPKPSEKKRLADQQHIYFTYTNFLHATAANTPLSTYFMPMPFTRGQGFATAEEMSIAYDREKQNWIDNNAMRIVPRDQVPRDANIIWSHTVYRWKSEQNLKARIVPHGNKDKERGHLRSDAPTMAYELLRLTISIAMEMGWELGALDIKAAYLQAKHFARKIYVRPPSEEEAIGILWELLAAAYGLADSGRLWYLTSYEGLLRYGLTPSTYDGSLFYKYSNDGHLVLVVITQVDNYTYTGVPLEINAFEHFMKQEFVVGECYRSKVSVGGAVLTTLPSGIILDQEHRHQDLMEFPLTPERSKNGTAEASRGERLGYMSLIGSLLFIGYVTTPILLRIASQMAAKISDLRVTHIKQLNALVRYSNGLKFQIFFPRITEQHRRHALHYGFKILIIISAPNNYKIIENLYSMIIVYCSREINAPFLIEWALIAVALIASANSVFGLTTY